MSIAEETPQETPEAAIKRLAKLSEVEYENTREEEAKKLNFRVGKLDLFVAKEKGVTNPDTKGRGIELYEPELWPEPINGAEALTEATNHILKHMVISEADAIACALWAAHTHIYDDFEHTPRLLISAPAEECGKSVLMTHMIGNLVTKPQTVELMTAAPFFRLSEQYKPTFLIDEADVFVRDDMDLLAAINNGWEPHGGVPRCVGDDNEVRIFSTHCPMAMAGIEIHNKLPKTTIGRSVVIVLERAAYDEIKEKTIYNKKLHQRILRETGRKIARWCNDNREKIRSLEPLLPTGVINRKAEKWSPLFAIAQVAGGEWPNLVIKAMNAQSNLAEPSKSELLLQDIKTIVRPIENIHTETLIQKLCELEDSLWKEYNFKEYMIDKKRITSRQLSNLLKKYNLKPKTVDVHSKKIRGYHKDDLSRVIRKYLPETPSQEYSPNLSTTPPLSCSNAGCSQTLPTTSIIKVTDRNQLKAPPDNESGGVVANNRGIDKCMVTNI